MQQQQQQQQQKPVGASRHDDVTTSTTARVCIACHTPRDAFSGCRVTGRPCPAGWLGGRLRRQEEQTSEWEWGRGGGDGSRRREATAGVRRCLTIWFLPVNPRLGRSGRIRRTPSGVGTVQYNRIYNIIHKLSRASCTEAQRHHENIR